MLWTIISVLVLIRIGFFRAGPLVAAPPRESGLTIGFLLIAAVVLYLVVGSLGAQVGRRISRESRGGTAGVVTTGPAVVAGTNPVATTEPGAVQDFIWEQTGAGVAYLVLSGFLVVQIRRAVVGGLGGFGLGFGKIVHGLGLGVIAALLFAPWYFWISLATAGLSQWLRHGPMPIHPLLEAMRKNLSAEELAALVAVAVVFAPVSEELVFRGLLQTYLLRLGRHWLPRQVGGVAEDGAARGDDPIPLDYLRAEPSGSTTPSASWRWFCILTASFLFAAIHIPIMGPEAFPPLVVLAITLGYMYERTGNLWACMALHGLFNLSSIVANLMQPR